MADKLKNEGGIPAGATRVGWNVEEGDAATIYTVPADTLLTITHICISIADGAAESGVCTISTTDEGEIASALVTGAGNGGGLNLSGLDIQLIAAKVLSWARVNTPICRMTIRGYTVSTA